MRIRRANGTGGINNNGYHMMRVPGLKKRGLHVLIAERALGKPLPKEAEVHHVDGDKTNNITNYFISGSARWMRPDTPIGTNADSAGFGENPIS